MCSEIREIFDRITERYQSPIRIGSRCESRVFYRVEYLSDEDLILVAQFLAERIDKVCSPQYPEYIVALPGNNTNLGKFLAVELGGPNSPLEIISYKSVVTDQACRDRLKDKPVILVNDVITTARSCLEAHAQTTFFRASVLCWAALIDRTFGPGPVSIVAAFTGEPITLV